VKVYLSTDMEGTAGIVDWAQCVGDGPEAVAGRELLLAEVNAAIDGALAAGAAEIVVNDSHSVMRNLAPARLHGRATYLSGRHKPLYMMEGPCAETVTVVPRVETAVVKNSITRFAASSLHPEVACDLIRTAAARAIEGLGDARAPEIPAPSTLEVTWRTADMAEMATWIRGVERTSARVPTATDTDRLRLFRTFITSVLLTQGIAQER
jgi:D-aminopeptidase